jgi:hypothetical protein
VTTIKRLMAFDLATDKKLWDKEMPAAPIVWHLA